MSRRDISLVESKDIFYRPIGRIVIKADKKIGLIIISVRVINCYLPETRIDSKLGAVIVTDWFHLFWKKT